MFCVKKPVTWEKPLPTKLATPNKNDITLFKPTRAFFKGKTAFFKGKTAFLKTKKTFPTTVTLLRRLGSRQVRQMNQTMVDKATKTSVARPPIWPALQRWKPMKRKAERKAMVLGVSRMLEGGREVQRRER